MIVSVIYQLSSGQTFDVDYYMKSHIPLVHARWDSAGLKGLQVLHGTGSPAGAAPAKLICLLEFDTLESFQAAVEKHGAEVMGDVPNFTDAQPSLQFNDRLA
jgi:uncharacterized protein (TIGR02118 family)